MFLVTAEQMKRADRLTIDGGIPSAVLMENAGRGAFDILRKYVPDLKSKKVAVVCGKGNNGGDGRVVARWLEGVAGEVHLFDVGAVRKLPLRRMDIIVDALFGIGLSRHVEGPEKDIIEEINRSKKWVFSLDIPSGLSADTGRPMGEAVRANLTATMGLPKIGLVLPEAAPYVGSLEVVDIGIPKNVLEALALKDQWITASDIQPLFTPRAPETHKGNYGHVLLVGGSGTKPGAVLMAGRSSLRAGSGLVTVALPDRAYKKISKNFLELMYEPQPSHRSGGISRKALPKILKLCAAMDAIAVGPGMGANADTKALVEGLLKKTSQPMVLDADGLNCLGRVEAICRLNENRILTPHPGEMSRLTGLSTAAIQKNRIGAARDFAKRHTCVLVLKGFRTIVATPDGAVFVNSTGNAGMATAGMGDVLTGVIVSLLAQGLSCQNAAVAGVWIHGRAGDRVAGRLGDRGLLATDVIEEIPLAIREVVS